MRKIDSPSSKQNHHRYLQASNNFFFPSQFNCNKPSMSAQGNTLQDNANVHDAILQVADGLGIDNRVILAIIMQESHGKVNTPNAADGQNTPGLMQAWGCPNHAGQAVVTRVCRYIQSPLTPKKEKKNGHKDRRETDNKLTHQSNNRTRSLKWCNAARNISAEMEEPLRTWTPSTLHSDRTTAAPMVSTEMTSATAPAEPRK